MPRIPFVEPDQAPPAVRETYERLTTKVGVPLLNVFKMFANNEKAFAGFAQLVEAVYVDPKLSPRYRELAYLRASQLNSCHY